MVNYSKREDIGVIEFNDADSRVNLLSHANLDALTHIIDRITEQKNPVKSLFFVSKKDNIFIAGADIKELTEIHTREQALELCKKGQGLFNKIEGLGLPTFAVVNGACIGGGLELALSCRYILSTDNKKVRFGLPEAKLGIIPGFGGIHRLIHRIGLHSANSLIFSGKLINAREALGLKLTSRIIPESQQFSYKKLISTPRSNSYKALNGKIREEAERHERGILADKIIQKQAKNSLSAYLLRGKYKNYNWIDNHFNRECSIKRCAIAGAGTMGRGIAYLISSEMDMSVALRDLDNIVLKKALTHIKRIYNDAVKRGLLHAAEAKDKLGYIMFGNGRLDEIDIVIEAVTEDIAAKKDFFAKIESELRKDCIITSNTSCISINELAISLKRPENFLGIHFFNPAYKMKLVEVIPSEFTDKSTLQRTMVFLQRLRRIPIIVKDSPGFLVNRMLLPYLNEALSMLQEGYLAEDIDAAMLWFGMPVGPLQLLKDIGIGVAYRASRILEDGFGPRLRISKMLAGLFDQDKALNTKKSAYNLSKPPFLKKKLYQEIISKLLFPMRREARLCLEEKIVDDREIIDLALLLGIGFPGSKRIWES